LATPYFKEQEDLARNYNTSPHAKQVDKFPEVVKELLQCLVYCVGKS